MGSSPRHPGPATGSAPVVVAEVERKFEPGPGFRLPGLSSVPGVTAVSEPEVHDLDATYFDTAGLRLAANKITLRRRTGGDDAGWHLKLPRRDGERDEVQAPLGDSATCVPSALREQIEVYLRGADLMPVVRLSTARTVRRLLGAGGAVLAEVAQDDVSAATPSADGAATTVSSWHELEVELVDGDRELLAEVSRRLAEAGAPPSASASKLARALGDRVPPRPPERPGPARADSAAAVLLSHLRAQITRLTRNDPQVRTDEPDAVHQQRVATRQLRSALATYRPLLDRSVTDPLRDELRWLGEVLGRARDAEVIRDQLLARVAGQPAGMVRGPVIARITRSLGERFSAARDEVRLTLCSARYFALLDALDRLLAEPPLTSAACEAPGKALLRPIRRTFTRLRGLAEASVADHDPDQRDALLHEVRKGAKRARYAGESAGSAFGAAATEWASRMEALQEVLGEHQDSVVIRAELLTLAAAAHAAGEDTFTYGRLHAIEEARSAATERRFEALWRVARKKRLHRWLEA